MRRLIINADDFGFTSGVNRAILEAHNRGVVTSTTLMANSPAFLEASTSAKTNPNLSIGCHIVLVGGEPVLPSRDIRGLTRQPGANGARFHNRLSGFAVRALTGRIPFAEAEAEATAQIRKIQAELISLTHFDTHKHTHIFPSVLRPLLQAARNCGIGAVRNPYSPPSAISAAMLSTPFLWKRHFQLSFLRRFADSFQREVSRAGLVTTNGTLGVFATGALDQKLFRAIVESIPEGTWEFVCHPGYNDAELQNSSTRLKESREQELTILTSPETKSILAEREIELISYRDLLRTG